MLFKLLEFAKRDYWLNGFLMVVFVLLVLVVVVQTHHELLNNDRIMMERIRVLETETLGVNYVTD